VSDGSLDRKYEVIRPSWMVGGPQTLPVAAETNVGRRPTWEPLKVVSGKCVNSEQSELGLLDRNFPITV
jgi:hypothetical protein